MLEHDFKKFPELTNRQLESLELVSPHPQITMDFDATVVKVHDGDTVTLRVPFRDFDFPLRFLGIDAPEMNTPDGPVSQLWLEGQLLGNEVMVQVDPDNRVDKYGRLLGVVLNNGMDVGIEESNLGLAVPFDQRREGQVQDISFWTNLKQWF